MKRAVLLHKGLTLTEVVICIPLVGLVMVGAMTSTGAVLRTWNEARESSSARGLAEQLMDEVLQQRYEEPDGSPTFGIETGEAANQRATWDDVDDYNGWTMSPPETKEAMEIDGHAGWTHSVTVAYVRLVDPTQAAASDEGLKRITVTVTNPAGQTFEMTGYRSRWGALEQPPATDATLQTYIAHELKMMNDEFNNQLILYSGTHVPNSAE